MIKLPLLEFVNDQIEADLTNVLVIACQHILGTTVNLFESLFEKGLDPKNVYLIGKCYSTNLKVYKRLQRRGIYVSRYSHVFKNRVSFDEQFEEYVAAFFQEVFKEVDIKKFRKIIILDDGGYLLSYANKYIPNKENVVGIEQTSSGYEKLRGADLKFPVINVAKSNVKLRVEAPLIAQLIVNKIEKKCKKSDKILVVGQGSIGKNITVLLKEDFSVVKYDSLTHNDPFPGKLQKKLGEYSVIIGATGQTILKPKNFGQLNKNCLLVSASSSDREFSAVYLRRKLKAHNRNCHRDIRFKGLKLLNGGFPINFDGKEHSLPPKQAQLTRALLLAAVLQSLNERGDGMKKLDEVVQKMILKKFYETQHSLS